MNILGIGGFSHNSAAAIVCDGELVTAVAEERISRIKQQGGVPRKAVAYCLETAGLSPDDIDHIGCYMRPGLRVARRLPYRLTQLFNSPTYSAAYMGYEVIHNLEYVMGMRSLCGRNTQLHYMEHHPAHAASAFLVSPFEEAALLSLDYVGEWDATWTGVGRGTEISPHRATAYPNSLGLFYTGLTDYLGFHRGTDEYKVMGLASYGEPEYYDEINRIFRPGEDGWYNLDRSWMQCHYKPGSRFGYFSDKFIKRFGPPRAKDEPIQERHRNLAASVQKALEDTVIRMVIDLLASTGMKHLCMAGGVALNCSMNGRLLRETPVEDIYVQPAASDDGISLGVAYQLHHRLTGAPRSFVMRSARIGPEYSNDEIKRALDIAKIPYRKSENVESDTADLLADGQIVGWFQGKMEFGPRALGGRSILADPTRSDMKDLVNKYVKHREEFRPFAPSCLVEDAADYFPGCRHAPFMQFVYPVAENKKEQVPAITHVDGTARVQTVSRDTDPRYYKLIEEFEKRKGVPVVLNTSFNIMGEPIVNTPTDAIRCFFGTGIDSLVLGDYIVTKSTATR